MHTCTACACLESLTGRPTAAPPLSAPTVYVYGTGCLLCAFQLLALSKMRDQLSGVVSEGAAREALAALGSSYEDILAQQALMEQLIESR